ncbi:hypothetical protein MTR67_040215 [Solanum verrucosum]|uniref:Uncharacterized protein n=1 Tax=Solanum verrucosum TaxID=315347 RepID=A0AAF0UJE4_SOLVR|nr:hypothetical protein MTR67_040215 [Solanum verrucosum]
MLTHFNLFKARGVTGGLAYLAHIRDVSAESPPIESISMVSKFLEVFSTDHPCIPPDRDIKFYIDLESGTRPISTPPYHMTMAVLRELNTQLHEFLDREFFILVLLLEGAPILFVKKKNGSMKMCVDYRQSIRKCALKDLSGTLVGIADAFGNPPGLLHRLSSVAFSIFVSWIIGRCSTASHSHSAIHRLLLFTADLLISFRAWHTGIKGEYAIYWRFFEWVRRFADLHFFVLLASFALFCLIVSMLPLELQAPKT